MTAVPAGLSQADFRCCLAAGFFAAASWAGFLPEIGINISFWAAAAFRGFLDDFFGDLVSAAAVPLTLRRSASIRSTTLLAAGVLLSRSWTPQHLLAMAAVPACCAASAAFGLFLFLGRSQAKGA